MRAQILMLLLAGSGALAAPSNKTCLVCHTAPLFDAEAFSRSVHAKLDCVDCHKGYDFSTHRAKALEQTPAVAAQIAKMAPKSTAPAALVACGNCHASQRDDLLGSVHGRWLREARPVAGPICLDCHGAVHAIAAADSIKPLDRTRAYSARCAGCHDNAELIKKAGIAKYPVATYRDSIHGRFAALGNQRAPGCANCHGSHDIAPAESKESAVAGDNKTRTCAECHPGATANFAATFTHRPLVKRPIPYYTGVFFSWLTSSTITFLFGYVMLDFTAELRQWFRRRRGKGKEPRVPEGSIRRFSIHALAQHWILLAAVVLLFITGWPLRAAPIGSAGMIAAIGGVKAAGIIHRIAGLMLGTAALYHVVYLTILIRKRDKTLLDMVPGPQDIKNFFHYILYFLGLREEPAAQGRWGWIEKFDYWAVFWGVAIMFGTGLVRWFPLWFGKWLRADLIEATQIAHGEEATLCALALFVWHLYNVHVKPSIFPMSWIWIDGRIGYAQLREEHRAEYDALVAQGKIPAAPEAPAPEEPAPKPGKLTPQPGGAS